MTLTQEQKEQVATWLKEGESLSGVQNRLGKDLGINMTFMEVRIMIDDLELELPDDNSNDSEVQAARGTEVLPDHAVIPPTQAVSPELANETMGTTSGGVRIAVDKLQRPGAVVSGDVTFSDGVSASWQVDQLGRLGLIPSQEGYQPSEDDITNFQSALQAELQKKGF